MPDVMLGASARYSPRGQQRRIADCWSGLCGGRPAPLTVRIVGPVREVRLDLGKEGYAPEAAGLGSGPAP